MGNENATNDKTKNIESGATEPADLLIGALAPEWEMELQKYIGLDATGPADL